MVPDKLDPRFLGSGAGLARGPGFYVARSYNLAADYADESSQDPDYEPDPFARKPVTPRKDGDAGELMILRVYALAPPSTSQNPTPRPLNTPSAWGVQTGAGDPNDDKKLPLALWPPSEGYIGTQAYGNRPIKEVAQQSNTELDDQRRDLEMAISPNAYDQIIVIPSIAGDADYNFFAGWRPHDDIVDHLTRPSPGGPTPRNTDPLKATDTALLDLAASERLRKTNQRLKENNFSQVQDI
jgi:hypothetical protein